MFQRNFLLLIFSLLLLWVCYLLVQTGAIVAMAQAEPAYVRRVRHLETERMGVLNPAGLAFSPKANAFQIVSKRQAQSTGIDLFQISPQEQMSGSKRLAAAIEDPINLTFDAKRNRLLFLRNNAKQLTEVTTDATGAPDIKSVRQTKIKSLGLQNPQGMTIDPDNGVLYILDATGPRLIQVSPDANGNFENALFTTVDLSQTGIGNPRGLAWHPGTRTLYLFSTTTQALIELTAAGQVIHSRDMSTMELRNSQTLVFAPSSDLTDDPAELSLYIADAGQIATIRSADSPDNGEEACATAEACPNHLYLPLVNNSSDNSPTVDEVMASAATPQPGTIVELTLAAPTIAPAGSFFSTVVQTIDLAALLPPSPDPSGLTYLATSNTLLISDGEVEETVAGITHFQGANVWELTLGGTVVRTANVSKIAPTVVPMTNEPPGVAWNPNNGHYYFSDDDARRVYDLNPGPDTLVGTADDTWTNFSTLAAGSVDPEGIAIDSANNQIFIADGTNIEIYQFSLNGTLLGHFDVEQYGVVDPESVEYNPDSGTLLVLSNHASQIIAEVTTNGDLLRIIDISAASGYAPAGLAYAPASDGSGAKRYYVVDRRVDNNANPNIIDGKLFELTAPPPLPAGNIQPTANAGPDQTITLPDSAILDGTVSDDGQPIPPGTLTTAWSQLSGPGSVTFANANAVDTTASFSMPGVYLLRLSTFDGALSAVDDLTITVNGGSGITSLDVRIATSADDAEENSSNNTMNLTSSDLDLLLDTGNTTPSTNLAVGLRFTGITVPTGVTIVNAFVQFTVDEVQNTAAQFTIQGHAIDNAPSFTSSRRSISNRPLTTAAATWAPVAWSVIGQSGPDQRTGNLTAIIQEIVNRPGWVSGNALALVLTGSGQRVAISFDGAAGAAPLLHIEYTTPPPTATETPTDTPVPPTATETPTDTPVPPTATETPTDTPVPPTATETPTDTPVPPTATETPTDTPVPPTATETPTDTPVPPTATETPTDTPVPPTATETPTDTPVPPTATETPTSAWSSSQTGNGNLSVATAAALQGSQGLRVQISSNGSIYVLDESPAAEARYRARFYFTPNSITMAEGDAHYLLMGYDAVTATPKLVLYVELRFSGGSYQIRLRQNDDAQLTRSTSWFTISNTSHTIELEWSAATTVGANNGALTLWLDNIQRATLTGIDNDTRRIDRIRLGAANEIDSGTRGIYYIDAFTSRRQTYIGP